MDPPAPAARREYRGCGEAYERLRRAARPRRFRAAVRALRRGARVPGGGRKRDARAPRARRRPIRSRSSWRWRWPTSASTCRRCKASCAGSIAGDIEVKRDFGERQRDEVRILTVHGAKGLEAPVVFLPDTDAAAGPPERLLWSDGDGLPLWCPRGELAAPAYRAEREALRRRQLQEYRRLLYVALTRAQDRLYVCGWQNQRPTREAPCWHALCQSGWTGLADPVPFDTAPADRRAARLARRGAAAQQPSDRAAAPRRAGRRDARVRDAAGLGARHRRHPSRARRSRWRRRGRAIPSRRPCRRSRWTGATASSAACSCTGCCRACPSCPKPSGSPAAQAFLALPVHALTQEEQDEIRAETMAVLTDPDLAELWGPASQAEVPVVGLIPGDTPDASHALSGQIDRVVVDPERVLVVDFKTVRPVPAREEEVPSTLPAAACDVSRRARPHLSRPPDRMRAAVDRRAGPDADQPGAARQNSPLV